MGPSASMAIVAKANGFSGRRGFLIFVFVYSVPNILKRAYHPRRLGRRLRERRNE
jgi:hypothetical protein